MDNRRFSVLVLVSSLGLFALMQLWTIPRQAPAPLPQTLSVAIDSAAPEVAAEESQEQEFEPQLPQFEQSEAQIPEQSLPVPTPSLPDSLPQVSVPEPVRDFMANLPDAAVPLPDIATDLPPSEQVTPKRTAQTQQRPSTPARKPRATAAAPRRSGVPALLAPISKPPYPDSARRKGLEGTVCLQAIINEQGQVMAVTITQSSGYAVLDKCARDHFKSVARFRAGCPGKVSVPFEFKLQ